ncbi:acyl carrier protein [Anaerosolibacter carboniphilus]|uniref:Acyl carrier protein n=1 Tax=Anaerosolibacter carboniphilus TaxID=1417629 RepID=A0A841KRQ4_9FIRM|nr:hypothetical protein [Anaerosolibacter carboniphilus]MBB6216424.1 acyl carrier protein [Anaerosolibacter carboniphilus]
MLRNTTIKEMIQKSFDSLYESGMIENKIIATDDTVLIGPGSELDSVAFVTLFVDIEDRLRVETNEEIYLVLNEIHDFNPKENYLTVSVLIAFIENLLDGMR